MAEKPEEQFTSEEKIAKAKELYARGCRNYYVKSYSEAADDLSEASKLFGEEYGIVADELGDIYLMYGKALVASGQDENKLIEIPEEDDDDDDEQVEEDDGESIDTEGDKAESNGVENGEKTNGHSEAEKPEEPTAGPSGENEESSNDVPEGENDDVDDGGNLELAWEVLQNAALIFERQGSSALSKLMDVFTEMAGISLENGNFDVAIKDFNRALDVFLDLEEVDQNPRVLAEIHYKVGLCQTAIGLYEDSVKSFKIAADSLLSVINKEKEKEQTDDTLATIKDLEETHQEIMNKITEIGETKAEEVEQVKQEMAKILGTGLSAGGSSSAGGAGCSSSSAEAVMKSPEADKPKPTDISHLIKRKKPDNDAAIEASPAKKMAVETSPGEKIAIAVQPEAPKVDEEDVVVNVIEN